MSSLNSNETRFLKLARQHPDGIDNDTIARELPDLTDEALMNVINTLSSKSLIQFLRKGSETIFQAKSDSEAEKMSGMDPEERLVFQQIEAAGNEGIWSKRIRIKSGLIATVVNRCIKKLEQKLLIKSVSSVKNPTQKIFMLFNLTPSVELTGGPWYTDQELDVDFIETLTSQCFKFIVSRSYPSRKPGAVYGPDYSFYPTAGQVRRFIVEMAISTVELSTEDVQTLLNILVYDGKIERRLPGADLLGMGGGLDDDDDDDDDLDSDGDIRPTTAGRGRGSRGRGRGRGAASGGRRVGGGKVNGKEPDYMYKAVRSKAADDALMGNPCGKCPVFEQCHMGSAISPTTCVYYKNWLDF